MKPVLLNQKSVITQITITLVWLIIKILLLFFLFNIPVAAFAANRTWTGAASTVWSLASNWSGNNLPGNGDNVLIPGGLTNYPVVTSNSTFKLLTINSSGTGGRLTMNSGTLNTSQVILNTGGLLIVNGGTMSIAGITINGTMNLINGSMASSALFLVNNGGIVNQSGGTIYMNSNTISNPKDDLQINAGGTYNQSGGSLFFKDLLTGAGTFNQTGAGALMKVNRHWQMGPGSVFNSSAGTVEFGGNGAQSDFASGTRQFNHVVVYAAVNPGFSVVAGSTVPISGNFTNNNTLLTNTVNATFIFNGTASQVISSATTGTAGTFGNLQVNKPGGLLTWVTNCNVTGNITISAGTVELSTFTCNRSTAGGVLTMSAGTTLMIGGLTGGQAGSNFPLNFSTVTINPAATIHYNGAAQTVATVDYGHLILSGNGGAVVKTLPSSVFTVYGNFSITTGSSSGVTANLAAAFAVSGNTSIAPGTTLNTSTWNFTVNGNLVVDGSYNSAAITYLKGNLSGAGTFMGTSAVLELNGFTLQTLPGNLFAATTLKSLTVDNPSGAMLSGILPVTEIVKVVQGDFNSNGYLTLVSSATQSALIDGSGAGGVSGLVTMQRYLPAGFGYKYLSSPFQSATVNEFSDDLDLSATFPTFYRYNENSPSSGWVDYTNASGVLQPLSGYAANFGTGTSAIVADISGIINDSPQSVALFNNNMPFTTGFNLVGNPYPSPVNWDLAAGWNRVNIDNAIYFFDASSSDQYGGTYNSYINGISSNGVASNLIPAMQGFFVHVSNGAFPVAATLSINNAARTTDLQPAFHRVQQNELYPAVRLQASYFGTPMASDALVVYFADSSTVGFDRKNDALEIFNTDAGVPSFYSLSADQWKLSINAYPNVPGYSVTIPLGIKTELSGQLQLKCSAIELVPDSIHVYLSDALTRINHDLRLDPEFRVAIDHGTFDDRFRLVFSKKELPYITDTDNFGVYSSGGVVHLYINPGVSGSGHVTISNLQGQELFKQRYFKEGHYTIKPGFSNGIYVVSYNSDKSSFSKKIFLSNQ